MCDRFNRQDLEGLGLSLTEIIFAAAVVALTFLIA